MPQTSNVVLKHIIMDHFSLAGTIDWFNQKAEFEQAIQYGLLSTGDNSVRWERAKLKPLGEALQAVKTFLAGEEGEQLRALQEPDVPMEPDDLEFWEHHLSI